MADNAWQWLRTHQPQNYEQLVEKLTEAAEPLSQGARKVLRQLAEVFQWCAVHGIELAELDAARTLPKYRDASTYMADIVKNDEPEAAKV